MAKLHSRIPIARHGNGVLDSQCALLGMEQEFGTCIPRKNESSFKGRPVPNIRLAKRPMESMIRGNDFTEDAKKSRVQHPDFYLNQMLKLEWSKRMCQFELRYQK
ncbi:hypothetical protein NQ318_007828 [Aromia moschata]|uniref:Uncharacterized protein n=1 Tax=Aromia moschata TaxID=1265417 RepID=A0AAV8YZV8_9CUCU|nr:hypothetical protein NQ318_007828 [Aromia moschata]